MIDTKTITTTTTLNTATTWYTTTKRVATNSTATTTDYTERDNHHGSIVGPPHELVGHLVRGEAQRDVQFILMRRPPARAGRALSNVNLVLSGRSPMTWSVAVGVGG